MSFILFYFCKPTHISSPFLSVDHDGPGFVGVILQDHAHRVAVHPLDVDGVGGLTGPVDVAAVGVQAQVMELVVRWLNTAAHDHGRLETHSEDTSSTSDSL